MSTRLHAALAGSLLIHVAMLYGAHLAIRGGAPTQGGDAVPALHLRIMPGQAVVPAADGADNTTSDAGSLTASTAPELSAPSSFGTEGAADSPGRFDGAEYLPYPDLDTPAEPALNADAVLPPGVRTGIDTIILRIELYIDLTGVVRDVRVLDNGADSGLALVVGNVFRSTNFSPALRNGIPVNSRKIIEIAIPPMTSGVIELPPPAIPSH